jgi:hypothetical protein
MLIGAVAVCAADAFAWLFLYADGSWDRWDAGGRVLYVAICVVVIPVLGVCLGHIWGAWVDARLSRLAGRAQTRVHLQAGFGLAFSIVAGVLLVLCLTTWILQT